MEKNKLRVLFIGKENDGYSRTAAEFVKLHFHDPLIVFSRRTDPFPEELYNWKGDLLISYLAQWIIPGRLLDQASFAAINLHPGPPEYPGIGCTNFAIYNDETVFGITCHHMKEKVDTGSIIAVRRFPVYPADTVFSITQRCYVEILHLFFELMYKLLDGKTWPESKEYWTRKPYTRKQLNALCELSYDMDENEIRRRVKATTYGDKMWAHYVVEGVKLPYSY